MAQARKPSPSPTRLRLIIRRLAPIYLVIIIIFYALAFALWRRSITSYTYTPVNWTPLLIGLVIGLALPLIIVLNRAVEASGEAALKKRDLLNKIIGSLLILTTSVIALFRVNVGDVVQQQYATRTDFWGTPPYVITYLILGIPVVIGLSLLILGQKNLFSQEGLARICWAILLAVPLVYLLALYSPLPLFHA